MIRRIKYIINLIFAKLSKKYAIGFYSDSFKKMLQNCHDSVIVEGNFYVSDPRNLIVGKNVRIGKNCKFFSEGGIYLEDNSRIGDAVILRTYDADIKFEDLNSVELKKMKPIIVEQHAVVENGFSGYKNKFVSSTPKKQVEESLPAFFIVSTGRSGTNALANYFNQHPDIECKHEPKYFLNRLSTELAHGFKSREEVKEELKSVFLFTTPKPSIKKVLGECDLKYSNLISILKEILPKCKFVWLIRNGEDFVASAFGRRWFDEYEYTFPNPEKSLDTSSDISIFEFYRMEYARYRVNGYLAGKFSEKDWKQMTCFERCCWYWAWWNEEIEMELGKLEEKDIMRIRLDEVKQNQGNLYSFVGAKLIDQQFNKTNEAYHQVIESKQWSEKQNEQFKKWCSIGMKKWFE